LGLVRTFGRRLRTTSSHPEDIGLQYNTDIARYITFAVGV
jgi:hypothetical protein